MYDPVTGVRVSDAPAPPNMWPGPAGQPAPVVPDKVVEADAKKAEAEQAEAAQAATDRKAAELAAHPRAQALAVIANLQKPHIGEDRLHELTLAVHKLAQVVLGMTPELPPVPADDVEHHLV